MMPTLTALPDDIAVDNDITVDAPNTPELHIVEDRDNGRSARRLALLVRLAIFTVPFVAVAAAIRQTGLISNDTARLLTQALALHRDPALTTVDFAQPPLLAMLVAIWPAPVFAQSVSALLGGAVALVLWMQLRTAPLPTALRVLLLLAFCTTPAVLFATGAHASDTLALLLLLLAWRSYVRFVHHGVTWQGFVAGLLLGCAFFSSFLTLLFVIPFALGAPSYLRTGHTESAGSRTDRTRRSHQHAVLAGVVVIAFPGICALLSWMYLAWLGSGQPFHAVQLLADTLTGPRDIPSIGELARLTVSDLARQPLYVLTAILLARRGPRQLAAHLFPLLVVTVSRAAGWNYDEGFAAACYIGFSVLALAVMTADRPNGRPLNVRRGVTVLIALACITQMAASTLPLRSGEARDWVSALAGTNNRAESQAAALQQFAGRLRTQPQGVVLTDYAASSIIARAGTTYPFLLPASDQFEPAVWNPAHVVDHVLLAVPTTESPEPHHKSRLDRVEANGTIPGFHVDTTVAGWQLYTRDGVADIG